MFIQCTSASLFPSTGSVSFCQSSLESLVLPPVESVLPSSGLYGPAALSAAHLHALASAVRAAAVGVAAEQAAAEQAAGPAAGPEMPV